MPPPGNGAITRAETQRAFRRHDARRCQQGTAENALRLRHWRGMTPEHFQQGRHIRKAKADTARFFRHKRAIQAKCRHGIPSGSGPVTSFKRAQHRDIRGIRQCAIRLFGEFGCNFACHVSAAPIRAR